MVMFSCSVLFGQSTGSYAAMYTDQMSGTPLADGSLYGPQRMVMSHPYFPFGAKVKLTNLQTHLVVEAFVADRPGIDEQNLVMISRKVAETIGINAGDVKLIDIQVLQFDVPAPQSPTQLSSRAAMVEPPPPPPFQPTNTIPVQQVIPQAQPPVVAQVPPPVLQPNVYNRPPSNNVIVQTPVQAPVYQAPPVYVPPQQAPPVYNRPPVTNTLPPVNTLPPANTQPAYVPLPPPASPRDIYASPTARPNVVVVPSTPAPSAVENGSNFLQQGIASYYGDQFQGKLTANGEIFNKNDMTAAHQGLPFGSIIRVTLVETGKFVDVRVNDRGPYVGTRILDLSEKAAKEIGLYRKGTAEVRITLLRGPRGETTVAQLTQRFSAADPRVQNNSSTFSPRNLIIPEFTIQLGAYRVYDQALAASRQIPGAWVETSEQEGRVVYRLNFKHFPNREDATRGLREVQNMGYNGFVRQVVH
jgi:rare lipoprotein A